MRRAVIRDVLAAAACLVWWWLLAAAVLGIAPTTPWAPAHALTLAPSDAQSVMGSAAHTAAGLEVRDLGKYQQALQSWQPSRPWPAASFRYLRYAIAAWPHTLELDLVVRNGAHPNDVALQPITNPVHGGGTLDLGDHAAWHGSILELGYSELPALGQVPPSADFAPFTLGKVVLESPSWRGALAAFVTHWLAYRPWTLHSINTVRLDADVPARSSPVLLFGLGLGGTVALLALVAGWRGRRLGIAAAVLVAGGWVALDIPWLHQLQQRDVLTQATFATRPWSQRAALSFDPDTVAVAARLRAVLAAQGAGRHVLVWTPQTASTVRLGYLLRPYNVAALMDAGSAAAPPDGVLVAFDDAAGEWHYDAATRTARRGTDQVQGDIVYRKPPLMVVAVRREDAP